VTVEAYIGFYPPLAALRPATSEVPGGNPYVRNISAMSLNFFDTALRSLRVRGSRVAGAQHMRGSSQSPASHLALVVRHGH